MSIDNYIWQMAESYCAGNMTEQQVLELEKRQQENPAFAADFQESVNLILSLQNSGRQTKFRSMLQDIAADTEQKTEKTTRTIPLKTHYWRTAAVAAGMALVTSIGSVLVYHQTDHAAKSSITQLSKKLDNELQTIKTNQHQLNQKIDKINANQPAPGPGPGNMSGTGFAITNDGYIATNYHVAKEADSLYIQTHDGSYHKAFIVAFDDKTDVAILQVQDKNFRFSKTDVPYTFATSKVGLGARVFTLGFPGDEIVYSEGYISSKNGLHGDSAQYRLELPAAPGQSGAPIVDANGDILGLVTSKETATEGTTYAVSSKAVLQLVHSMAKPDNLHLPKANKLGKLSREQQIKKLEEYTCIVQVYK
jgi:serine protease Do